MSEELDDLQDDIRHDWWTVVGFWHDTWERWAEHYDCLTPRMAEDLAMLEANTRGRRLAVVAVFEGKLMPADEYALYIDPEANDVEEMKGKLRSLGYLR